MTWKLFLKFLNVRSWIMSPWKILFNFKFLGMALLLFIGVRFLPDPIQQPIRDVASATWKASRAVARELGLFKLIGYGMDGVSEGVKLVSGPDEIENGPGNRFYYGNLPVGAYDEKRKTVAGQLISTFKSQDSEWASFRWNSSWALDRLPWPTIHDPLHRSKAMIALEQKLKSLVVDCESLWIYVGLSQDKTAWALVIDELDQSPRYMAFRLPRVAQLRKSSVSPFLVDIMDLESMSGLRFFETLDDQFKEPLLKSRSSWVW